MLILSEEKPRGALKGLEKLGAPGRFILRSVVVVVVVDMVMPGGCCVWCKWWISESGGEVVLPAS